MRLAALTDPSLIVPAIAADDAAGMLRALAQVLASHEDLAPDEVEARLTQREALGSTAIGHGVAIPHCKMPRLDRVVLAIAIARRGIDFEAADGQPVRLFFAIVSPEKRPADHLKCLAAISRWVQEADHVERLLALGEPAAIYRLLGPDPEAVGEPAGEP